jgi:hypothetical protein
MESESSANIDSAIDSPEVIILNDLPPSPSDAVVAAVAGLLVSHVPDTSSELGALLQTSDAAIDPPKVETSTDSNVEASTNLKTEDVEPAAGNSWNYREEDSVRVKNDSDSEQKPKRKKHHRRHETSSSSSSSSSSSDSSGEERRRQKKKKRRDEAQSQTSLETQVAMLTSIVNSGKIVLFFDLYPIGF